MKNILIVCLGYYGRGTTIAEAYDNVKKAGAASNQSAVLMIGKTELNFIDIMHVEGEMLASISFTKLSHLKCAKIH